MAELFESGAIVGLAIAVLIVEMLVLATIHARTGRGIAARQLAGNFLAGVFLLLALRAALAGAGVTWVALCLGAALVAHAADLRSRWRPERRGAVADSRREYRGGTDPLEN